MFLQILRHEFINVGMFYTSVMELYVNFHPQTSQCGEIRSTSQRCSIQPADLEVILETYGQQRTFGVNMTTNRKENVILDVIHFMGA